MKQYNNKNIPNVFVIGYERSGTTLLYTILDSCEEVCLPYKKEINFFDKNFSKGEKWYLKYFPDLSKNIICDITPSYIYDSDIHNKIYQYNTNAKIIIILRNPISLIQSLYLHEKRTNKHNLSFNEYFSIKENREKCLFYEKIINIRSVFKDENINIFIHEENISDINNYVKKINEFLNISIPPKETYNHVYENYVPKFRIIHSFLFFIYKILHDKVQNKLFHKIVKNLGKLYKIISTNKNDGLKLSASKINEIEVFYKDDIKSINELLEQDLINLWRS